MSWKKNGFSYLLWILYAVTAEVGLVCLADAVCDSMGMEIYIGTVACALYIMAAGLGVWLIHRFAAKYSGAGKKSHSRRIPTETGAVLFFLAVGLALRVRGMGNAVEGNAYYELAAMVSGEEIPRFSHGAEGIYTEMLHGLFYFLGNKLTAAVWVQILLQLGAMLLLYFAVRRFAGRAAAMVMLGFGMFSSYLREEALCLSPAMLYLFLWAAALLLTVTAAGTAKGMWEFLMVGLVISFTAYLDVSGWLLFLVAVAVIFCEEWERAEKGRNRKCLLGCILGTGAGFFGCVLADALIQKDKFAGVLTGWFQMYRPQSFQLPVSVAAPETMAFALAEYIVLFCVLTLGMFSFWRNRQRDYQKGWILLLLVLLSAGCFGIFTEEVPMGLYLYLVLTIMAGIAVEECIREVKPATARNAMGATVERTDRGADSPAERTDRRADSPAEQTDKGADSQPHSKERAVVSEPVSETTAAVQSDGEPAPQPKTVKLIENPLPLPKKHVKRTLDYGVAVPAGKDDFDLEVDEKDDFDI
ncbi:MAG: hypothetical protein NC517_11205 [Firmicutes bacterium]|nr:hypothetical protein [Bacillota bacterium]